MPPIDLDPREDVTAYTVWSKKRKAGDPLNDEVRREKGLQTANRRRISNTQLVSSYSQWLLLNESHNEGVIAMVPLC